MKVAIPVFHTKISPRFDQAQGFVLLETDHSEVVAREDLATRGWSEKDKMRQLVELGIETLICGGIDRASLQYLSFNGVSVYSWVTGEVDDAVTCFLDNRMKPGIILGEQGKMMGRWQFCRGRNHLCNMFQTGFYSGKKGVSSMPRGEGRGPHGQGQGSGMGRGAKKAGKGGCGSGRQGGKGRGQGVGDRNGDGRGPGTGNRNAGGKSYRDR
jgi:predicted Fe-Mo cluster-binding NifX family protein